MSFTVDQVAEQVQIHPDTVRAEIRRGNLEAWKAGNSLRIEPEALEAWKRRKRVNRPDEAPRVSGLRALEGGHV